MITVPTAGRSEEAITIDIPLLSSSRENMVTPEQNFTEQWCKFYEEYNGE